MATTIRLMLTRGDGAGEAALEAALRAEADRLDHAGPGRFRHRRAYRLADEQLREVANGSAYSGGPPFDAMMEVALAEGADIEAAEAALEGFAERLAVLVKPERSAVLVGPVHQILPGAGPIHVAIGARRLPHLSHEGYIGYWFDNHSDQARATEAVVPGMGYRQFHADPQAAAKLARRAGLAIDDFDGMAETYFADPETLRRIYAAPGVLETSFADERRFVDHGRSVLSLFRMAPRQA